MSKCEKKLERTLKGKIIGIIEVASLISLTSVGIMEGFLGFIGKTVEEVEPAFLWALFTLNWALIVLIAQKAKECSSAKFKCVCDADNNLQLSKFDV